MEESIVKALRAGEKIVSLRITVCAKDICSDTKTIKTPILYLKLINASIYTPTPLTTDPHP
jgi:hypothetical protein